ncbi:MAG: hypothetical protein ACRD8W_09150 [Nitrososphaeraceae archaeon]
MKKYNLGMIATGGLMLTIVLSSISYMEGTQLTFAQGLDQQQNMSAMSNMDDNTMMKDTAMSNTDNMSNMMMTRMVDMMDRMNRMMDMMMMMMDMPMDTNNTDMMSMSNDNNISMGSTQNQTGDMMR